MFFWPQHTKEELMLSMLLPPPISTLFSENGLLFLNQKKDTFFELHNCH